MNTESREVLTGLRVTVLSELQALRERLSAMEGLVETVLCMEERDNSDDIEVG